METNRLHEMYRLLNECGEDTSCGCGCGAPPDPRAKGKKVLDEKPKKKMEAEEPEEDLELSERRKVGVRVFKVIRKLRGLMPAKTPKVGKVKNPKSAIRSVARNRHR